MTWLLPERYSGNEVAVETVCSLVGLLSLYHERILNDETGAAAATMRNSGRDGERRGRPEAGLPWPLMIAIVQQVEVLGEVAAAARGRATAGAGTGSIGVPSDVGASLGDGSSYKYMVISLIESLKAAFRYCQLARGEGNILIDGNAFDTDRNDCNNIGGEGRAGPKSLPGLSGRWEDDDDIGLGGSMTPTQRRRAAQRAMSRLRNKLKAESRAAASGDSAAEGPGPGDKVNDASDEDTMHDYDSDAGAGSPSSLGSNVGNDDLALGEYMDLKVRSGAHSAQRAFVGPPWWFQRQQHARGDDNARDKESDGMSRGAGDAYRRCPSLHPSLHPGKMPPQVCSISLCEHVPCCTRPRSVEK